MARFPSVPAAALALAALTPFLLAGCSDRRDFPSLAERPIERAPEEAAPTAEASAPTADPQLRARATALSSQAREGHDQFVRTADQSCGSIARGVAAAEGSEAWLAAQQALSALEAARQPVASARAEIDRLAIDTALASPAADLEALTTAGRDVGAIDAAEEERLAAVQAGRCG